MSEQRGFFDVDDRLTRLSALGDQLLAFAGAMDFELFRPALLRALAYSDGARGGRPPFDAVLMFKVLIIQGGPHSPGLAGRARQAAPEGP